MKKFWIPICVFCAMFLQGTLIPALFKTASGPNIVLALTLVITLVKGRNAGLISAVVMGFYQDILVGQYIGLNVALMVGLVFLIAYVEQFLFKNSLITPALLITGGTIVKEFLFLVIIYALGFRTTFSFLIVKKILIMSGLNAIIGTLIYNWGYLSQRDAYDRSMNF